MNWTSTEYLVCYHIGREMTGSRTGLARERELDLIDELLESVPRGGYWLDTGRSREWIGTCAVTGRDGDSLMRLSYVLPEDVNA